MQHRATHLPLSDYPAQRIALIKPSALGDIVHTLPALGALRRRFPAAHITWIVSSFYAPLLRGHPDLNAVLAFDRSVRASPWQVLRHYSTFIRQLQSARFNLVLDLQGLLRSGLIGWFSGAQRRVGLASAREGSRWLYTDRVDDGGQSHAVDRYLRVIRALGGKTEPVRFHVPIDESVLAWAKETLADFPAPWLCFGVGARWRTKRWPVEHFATLAQRAQQVCGGSIVFVGREDEAVLSRAVARTLAGPACDLTGKTTLPQLAAVLSLADVMVANDTGPLHLAAALGRPVVAPYTCTKVQRHGPYGQTGRAVATGVWCHGSYLKNCPRLDCMRELTPDRLWPLLRDALQTWERHHQPV